MAVINGTPGNDTLPTTAVNDPITAASRKSFVSRRRPQSRLPQERSCRTLPDERQMNALELVNPSRRAPLYTVKLGFGGQRWRRFLHPSFRVISTCTS
jgi:hypothetical protein